MRSYEKINTWLTFSCDLIGAPLTFWIMAGECQAKCELVANALLNPEAADRLRKTYMAKGGVATNAIEGSTLLEAEALAHLDRKLTLPPSREYQLQEVSNIMETCGLAASGGRQEIDPSIIKNLNERALNKLKREEGVVPGAIRGFEVSVARYKAPPAADCEHLLERLCQWLNSDEFAPPPGMATVVASIKAIMAHLYLAWIRPFGDGNGRTARLLEYQILVGAGVPAPAAQILTIHYSQTRSEYMRQLEAASRGKGNIIPFLMYAIEGFRDGLSLQLQTIREQQWDALWRNYVQEKLGRHSNPGHERRRNLVLDLSAQPEPVALSQLTLISPRVARAYASRSDKTLSRDLQELIELGLLEKSGDQIRARKEILLAFLPQAAR
jgi:Fic family protein